MEYRGRVKDGVIVLEEGAALQEGVEVRVRTLSEPGSERKAENGQSWGRS
jgi:hypothetical protein